MVCVWVCGGGGGWCQGPHIYLDPWRILPFSLSDWWQTANCTGDKSLSYWADYCTGQTVLLGAVCSHVPTQPDRASVISGELLVYDWLEYSADLPEGHPGHLAYTFVIRILSTSLTFHSFLSAVTPALHLCVCCTPITPPPPYYQ